MSRLIDADAFKKYIVDGINDFVEYSRGKISAQHYELAVEMTKNFIRDIDEQPTVNKWIPCSERLPKNDVDVIFNAKTCGVEIGCRRDGNWFTSDGEWSYIDNEVFAWQPLPEPYKER